METILHSGLSSPISGDSSTLPNFRFLPSHLEGLKLWTRYNSGITEGVSGVSQWDDVSGNGNHLKQANDANRMTKEADGSILGNGVDQFLKADAFTWEQPETIFILFKQITWTSGDRVFDGNTLNTGVLFQTGTTPSLSSFAGAVLPEVDLTLGSYGIVSVVFNTTSSIIQLNNETPITANGGPSDMNGFTLGSNATPGQYGHTQTKEIIGYSGALDAATRAKVIAYLSNVGGL